MKKLFLSVILLSISVWAAAQVSVTASVNKTSLALDDELTLSVEVKGASGNMLMPELPSLPAFNVYSREVQQSSINGKTTTLFRYVMLPRFVGKATIGAIRFTHNGKTYSTEPMTVTIYRNAQGVPQSRPASSKAQVASNGNYDSAVSSRPRQTADPKLPPLERDLANQAYARGDENFFLVSAVTDKTPYINQPITFAFRFYASQSFYDAPYKKPSVTNIFMEDAGHSQGTQSIGGVLYRYEEQRYTLTAATAGKTTIGPASVQYMTGSSPLSFFDRMFGGSVVQAAETVRSAPITLDVRPLPIEGKPKTFYGAVGEKFTISAQADRPQVEAGEAVTLTITVKGTGSLKSTTDLKLPPLPGLKTYDTQATSGSVPSNGQPRSYKIFKTVLVPSASGKYTIPPIKWSYFNPETTTYETIQTDPISLTVSPSTKADAGFDFSQAAPAGNGFRNLGQDIAYLKNTSAPDTTFLARLSRWNPLNWAMLALLIISGLFASVGRKSLAQKRAYSTAKNLLKKAASYEAVSEAMSGYLQQKLKISTGSLPLKAILKALQARGATPATAEAFAGLWQQLDAVRFAPGAQNTQDVQILVSQARDILKLLEEETR